MRQEGSMAGLALDMSEELNVVDGVLNSFFYVYCIIIIIIIITHFLIVRDNGV